MIRSSARMGRPPSDTPSIRQLKRHVGASVTLRGWVQAKRSSGKIHFVQIRDGSGVLFESSIVT